MGGAGGSGLAVLVEGVVKRYGRHLVLRGVSLRLRRGEKLAIVGPNGSGKTSLIKCMLGLTRCQGRIVVLGETVGPWGLGAVSRRVGYMPERGSLPRGVRVEDYLARIASLRGCSSYMDEASMLGLTPYLGKPVRVLSQGYRRRLLLAASLLCRPELLVLDEPYANIDVETRIRIDEALGSLPPGTSVLLTSHVEPGFPVDKVAIMVDGVLRGPYPVFRARVWFTLDCGGRRVELHVEPGDAEGLRVLNERLGACRVAGLRVETFSDYVRRVLAGLAKTSS